MAAGPLGGEKNRCGIAPRGHSIEQRCAAWAAATVFERFIYVTTPIYRPTLGVERGERRHRAL